MPTSLSFLIPPSTICSNSSHISAFTQSNAGQWVIQDPVLLQSLLPGTTSVDRSPGNRL